MSENLVRSVLKEYIEGDMPNGKNPWPAISAKLPTANGNSAALAEVETERQQPGRTVTLPGRRGFRLNIAMALVAVLALAGLTAVFIAARQRGVNLGLPLASSGTPTGSEFLPTGMVRHIVLTGSLEMDGTALGGTVETTEKHHEEFWLTQGQSHPLMKDVVTAPISATNWLDDSGYYEYESSKVAQVVRSAYDPQLLAALLPDPEIVTKTLQLPNAHLVGNDTLDGRPAVVIAVPSNDTASATPSAKPGTTHKNTVTTYWIDRNTNQLLQATIEITTVGGSQNGLIDKTVNKIALDELLPRSAFPADFFTLQATGGGCTVQYGNPDFGAHRRS